MREQLTVFWDLIIIYPRLFENKKNKSAFYKSYQRILNSKISIMYFKQTVFTLFITILGFSTLTAQTPCSGGMANSFLCSNVDLMAHMTTDLLSPNATAPLGNDVWGWTSPSTGKEYALVGLRDGTAFVDVSTPTTPIVIGHLANVGGGSNIWRDIKVVNNYAYIGSEDADHDLQVFDLSQLDGATGLPVTFTAPTFDIGSGNSHNVVGFPEDNCVITVGGSAFGGGLAFHDVSTPNAPVTTGGYALAGESYSHDAMCVIYRGEDTEHIGKQICFGFNDDAIVAVDVTDKAAPVGLSNTTYPAVSYIHQGWITDDHKYIYLNDELDENATSNNTRTHIIDLSDLDEISYSGFHESAYPAIDHNLYLKGNYMYQANYRAGLRILDVQNRLTPVEEAFFDVYPTDDNRGSNGAWSVYPYFKSGILIVNTIGEGFFVLQPTNLLQHYIMEHAGTGVQTVTQGDDAVYTIDLTAYYGYAPNVNVSLSGVPVGASAGFASSVSPDGILTITISNTAAVTPGNYQLILTGNNGDATSEESLSLGLIVNSILPVELVDFKASAQRNSIHLNWETATEIQNKGFEIQRSINNKFNKFEAIGWVDGNGNSEITQTYFYEDKAVKTGINYYYRLRQVDEDGTEKFSKIISAKIVGFEQMVDIFPNPVTNFLNVKFDAFDFPIQNVAMSVMNVNGQILQHETLEIPAGVVNYELDTESLSEGIYIIRFVVDNEEFTKRFVKM